MSTRCPICGSTNVVESLRDRMPLTMAGDLLDLGIPADHHWLAILLLCQDCRHMAPAMEFLHDEPTTVPRNYLAQLAPGRDSPVDTTGFVQVFATSADAAALEWFQIARPAGAGPWTVVVAIDRADNKHPNGVPVICSFITLEAASATASTP
jgi:hypothetical protein